MRLWAYSLNDWKRKYIENLYMVQKRVECLRKSLF